MALDNAKGRAMEIEAYVRDQELDHWFALDDFDLGPFLDVCAPRVHAAHGLTSEFVDEVIARLKATALKPRVSNIERLACEQLQAVLETTESETPSMDSPKMGPLLECLDVFLHHTLNQYSSTWFGDETTDGTIGYLCERTGQRGLRIVGLCWLMGSQGHRKVPVSIELHADESFSFVEKIACCLDEASLESPTTSIWPEGVDWSTWELRYHSQRIQWLHTGERTKPGQGL